MTARQPCPPAPGPLEAFAVQFDALFGSLGQRRSFRGYLSGLLAPRDRNKTLTALAGAEPVVQAQSPAAQRLQYFLSEADWSAEPLNARRLALLQSEAAIAAHRGGVLVLDDTGDRKDGTATAHVGRQDPGSVGKIDNGIVAVPTLWTHGCTTRCTSLPTRRHLASPLARRIRAFAPSRRSPSTSSSRRAPPASPSAPSSSTASTETTLNSR